MSDGKNNGGITQDVPVSDEAHSFGLSSTAAVLIAVGMTLLLVSRQVEFGFWTILVSLVLSLCGVLIQVMGGFKSSFASIALGVLLGSPCRLLFLKYTATSNRKAVEHEKTN